MHKHIYLLILTCLFIQCKNDNTVADIKFSIQNNPYGFAPLTAMIALEENYDDNTIAEVTVKGKAGLNADIVLSQSIKRIDNKNYVPIIGLYADYDNVVEVKLIDKNTTKSIGKINANIKTEPLIFDFVSTPKTTGNIANDNLVFMVLYSFVFEKGKDLDFIQTSVALDKNGDIRWYGDFQGRSHIVTECIDGFLYAGSNKGSFSDKIVKYNLLGQELASYDISMDGKYYNTHHDIRKNAKGNLLLTVNKKDHPSMENFIIEYDMDKKKVVNALDLENCMPTVDDIFVGLPFSPYANKKDYIHINGIYPDTEDNSIIVSSRHAGVCEVDADDGEMKWFLFPHVVKAKAKTDFPKSKDEISTYFTNLMRDFSSQDKNTQRVSSNGNTLTYNGKQTSYEELLLKPISKSGESIADQDVVLYAKKSEEFTYPLRQHSPIILKNGNLALFDNGDPNMNAISRAVEYEIIEDDDNTGGKIKQVWEYIQNENKFAQIVGNIEELDNGNRFINFGAINYVIGKKSKQNIIGNIVEVTSDYPAKEIFNLKVELPNKSVVYRASKMDLNQMSY